MTAAEVPPHDGPILLCTDGSDASLEALEEGLAILHRDTPFVLVTVADEPDATLVTGAGMAGGVMSPEEFDREAAIDHERSQAVLAATAERLGLEGTESVVLRGDAASAICILAEDRRATAIVMGTRGRGGLKRAVLGSVSDHVVRNAPCLVMVSRGQTAEGDG